MRNDLRKIKNRPLDLTEKNCWKRKEHRYRMNFHHGVCSLRVQ